MTFSDLAIYVQSDLIPDGDKMFPTVTSNYFSSPFGIRLATFLRSFSVDSYLLFSSNVAITVVAGDREYDFSDPANCALSMFDVRRVWLSNMEIKRLHNAEEVLRRWSPLTAAGNPGSFAKLNQTKIIFDCACASDQPNSSAQGYYRHPAITSDNDTVYLPEEHVHLFSRYAGVLMREPVAADEVGLSRLARFDKSAYEAIIKIRSQAFSSMYSGGR